MGNKFDTFLLKIRETDLASEIENDSSVPGETISDALETLAKGGDDLPITQTSHGFSIGDAVYINQSTGLWGKAKSDSVDTLGIGIVSSATANTFTLTTEGYISSLTGLTKGAFYYVSDVTAGLLTVTEGVYSNPLLQAISTTEGIVLPFRASEGDADLKYTLSDYDSVNLNYLYVGTAVNGSLSSDAVWKISRFNFSNGIIQYANSNESYDNIYDNREALVYG